MIILIMALFAIMAFLSNMLIKPKGARYATTLLMFIGLITSVVGIVSNMHDHYGMKVVTTTTKKEIYSAGADEQTFGVLLYQNIGTNGKENAYIYKQNSDDKKVTISKPDLDTTSSRIAISGGRAYRLVTTKRYVYQSDIYRFLFGISNNENQLKHRHVTYQVPDTWVAMTSSQAKSLAKKMTPTTDTEKAAVVAQQKQLAELAKTDPIKAATLQANQVKKILQIK